MRTVGRPRSGPHASQPWPALPLDPRLRATGVAAVMELQPYASLRYCGWIQASPPGLPASPTASISARRMLAAFSTASGSNAGRERGGGHCWSRSGLPQARDLHISPRYCQSSPMAIVMECHYQQGQPETSIYAPDTGSHQQWRSLWNATINRGKYPHWLSVSARERGRIGRARPVQVTMGGEAESAGRRRRRFSWLRAVHRQKLLFCTHSGNQHSVSRAAAK